jgi:signal transduction histidine kinase
MNTSISRVEIRFEQDVVHARRRARFIAEMLGFDRRDQTRISTAVSEIARNAHQYGHGGEVEFLVEGEAPPQSFAVIVRDHGPGIPNLDAVLEGHYASGTGLGLGIVGSRRLLDHLHVDTRVGQGTTVELGKVLPSSAPPVTPAVLRHIAVELSAVRIDSPMEEVRTQNLELLSALELLRERDEEVTRVNRELSETNTGVVALYSELERNTQRIQHAEQMLRARNEELKDFAHTVAHDLKAPLRGIAGYAQELERKHKAGLGERAQFCLGQIVAASTNLDRLIEDLLRFARLDAEALSLTEVNLRELIEAILSGRRASLTEQHVEVKLDIRFQTLRTWERGLVQVMTNLLDNALKYSRRASPPRVGIVAEETGSGWRIVVSDNGIGFDMIHHDRIFGLFSRLVRADEFEGTGAGLAIVKKIVERLGGSIRAESAPGQGASFRVELPSPPPERGGPP